MYKIVNYIYIYTQYGPNNLKFNIKMKKKNTFFYQKISVNKVRPRQIRKKKNINIEI